MKATTSLSIEDLEAMAAFPMPRLSRQVTLTSALTFSAKDFVTQRVGTLTDNYIIGEKLGSGGFGEVYACVHKDTGIERAVKILEKSKYCDHANEEVTKEFNILKELDHPNILRQIEMMFDEKHFYIVTEICRGGELFDEIQEWGNFIEEDAAELIRHVLGAINYCHKQNIVHRDLKPENILLEEGKELDCIKIIDFGLSQIVEKDTELTDMAGSIYYIAPEVLKGSHSMKCDIWSCGVIAFVLMSGYAPFDGHSDDDIKAEILCGEFTFDDEVWDDVSDQAKDFIRTLLTFDPKERPTAEEALQHPWIQECRMASSERLKQRESVNQRAMEALHNLERFTAQNKLKQATCAFIASQLVLKEEKKKIDELFRALDMNDNGRLSKEDVRTGYKEVFGQELADDMVKEMFKRIDYDNTGYIEYSEFVIATMNEKDLLNNDKLKHAFNMFDADGSGEISKDELVDVLSYFQSVDKTLDLEAINRIIRQVDEDDDGQISFDEFTAMMFKTAEDAVEEEILSLREQDDPVILTPTLPSLPPVEPPTNNNETEISNSSQKQGGVLEAKDPKSDTPRKPAVRRVSGAMGTKACLALFERNIQKNRERGFDSQLFPDKSRGSTPIARLSARWHGKLHRRASQERIQKVPTPVNRTRIDNGNGASAVEQPLDDKDRGSSHSPKTIKARAALFEELIKKNQSASQSSFSALGAGPVSARS